MSAAGTPKNVVKMPMSEQDASKSSGIPPEVIERLRASTAYSSDTDLDLPSGSRAFVNPLGRNPTRHTPKKSDDNAVALGYVLMGIAALAVLIISVALLLAPALNREPSASLKDVVSEEVDVTASPIPESADTDYASDPLLGVIKGE